MEKKNPIVKKLALLRVMMKMIESEVSVLEENLKVELQTNPIPNVSLSHKKGQVRPKWKEEFIALANRFKLNGNDLATKVQEKTEPGNPSTSIVIGSDYDPDIETVQKIMEKFDE